MDGVKIIEIDRGGLTVESEAVIPFLGYPKGGAVPARVASRLPEAIERARRSAEPAAVVRGARVAVAGVAVSIEGGPAFRGAKLSRALRDAERAVLFAATLGPKISAQIAAAADPFAAFLLDAAASALAERAAELMQQQLAAEAFAEGLYGGLRYSPGYCDWPVVENRPLLQFLGASAIGVEISESGMMSPRKSISGLIGYGPDQRAIAVVPCRACDKADCPYRR